MLSVALEWAATASSAKAVSTGCSGLKRLTEDPDYRLHGAREQHAP